MKQWFVLVGTVLALGIGQVAFAQPDIAPAGDAAGNRRGGRGMGPMNNGPMGQFGGMRPQMKFDGGSLYLLQGNELVKYDGITLRELGKVKFREEAAPRERGQGGGPQQADRGPAAFLIAGDDVLLVAGDTFYRIENREMKIAAQVKLPVPAEVAAQPRPPMGALPQLEVGGKLLFVLAGNQLYSIDIANVKVLGQAEVKLPLGPPPGGIGQDGQERPAAGAGRRR